MAGTAHSDGDRQQEAEMETSQKRMVSETLKSWRHTPPGDLSSEIRDCLQ